MMTSIESLERLERAHEVVTSLSVEVFPGALQTEQKIGGWREILENEMNLKDSEAYHKPTGSKYLVGSSSAPYCNSRYPTHMVVTDARTQQVLIDQLFSVPKCVREVEPLLGAAGYRTRRNIVRTHGEYPCHCLAQTLWYPKRGNLMLVWDVEELYFTGLPDQNQQVSIVVGSAMLAVRCLEANADTSEQETAVNWIFPEPPARF